MTSHLKIAFLGGGAMGEAIIKALIGRAAFHASHILVSEPDEGRRNTLRDRYGIHTYVHNAECAREADILVLAVKPQVMSMALADVRAALRKDALVFSIAAGITIDAIRSGLHGEQPVVRTIPNTPAQIGQGMTAWLATPNVSAPQLDLAKLVLSAMGADVRVDKESQIDMATAINGSGPGFLFLLMEAMIDGAVHLGFMRPVAEQLVMQTFKGSVEYALQSPLHLAQLRNQVTSAGGTTAAGIYELEKAGVRTALADAIWAAYRRSVELGK